MEGGRFTGSVRSNQGDYISLVNLEGNPFQGLYDAIIYINP